MTLYKRHAGGAVPGRNSGELTVPLCLFAAPNLPLLFLFFVAAMSLAPLGNLHLCEALTSTPRVAKGRGKGARSRSHQQLQPQVELRSPARQSCLPGARKSRIDYPCGKRKSSRIAGARVPSLRSFGMVVS